MSAIDDVSRISRRSLLARAAGAAVASTGAGMLGGLAAETARAAEIVRAPKRGGTLRAGLVGGSTADTLDPFNSVTTVDFARAIQIYDQLTILNPDGSIGMWLAEEITPNATATEWTVRLRPDVTFHNGKPLTAADVIYSFKVMLNPKKPTISTVPFAPIELSTLKMLDRRTVRLGTSRPFSTFLETAASLSTVGIIPVGFDIKKPVGTGPFMFQSFTPGRESVFVRNPNYWTKGLPYVDTLQITNYPDETSQINALMAGQVDAIDQLSSASLSTIGKSQLLVSQGGGFNPFTMRMDVAPFTDVRVRQAFRLLVDRPQLNELVFRGTGKIANDLWSPYDPVYDHALPQRTQDIAQAKSLLKKAGHQNLTVELVTSDIAQGVVQSAQVFAQQASAAGVSVKIRQVTVTEFYGPQYLKWPFAQDYWFYLLYFPQVADSMLPGGLYNETHYDNPAYFSLYNQALRTTDLTKRKQIAADMQQIDYDSGTYIIPQFAPVIDAHGSNVSGVHASKTGQSLGNYDFKRMWIA